MRASYFLSASAFLASALAAPAYSISRRVGSSQHDFMSDYFNLLARKIQTTRGESTSPVCDLSKAVLPEAPTPLPPPSAGLVLKHVAIGRGTQNYTCNPSNPTSAPVPNGALATLYNVSCIASLYPDILATLSGAALAVSPSPAGVPASNLSHVSSPRLPLPGDYFISGSHYFLDTSTPFFNLNTPTTQLGEAHCALNSSSPAPADAPVGPNGETAVAWLKLTTKAQSTGQLREVYRVSTAGGRPPATCEGMGERFGVEYAAQYWFYEARP